MPVARNVARTAEQKRVRFGPSPASFKDILHVEGYTGFEQLADKEGVTITARSNQTKHRF
jgi:hypothetical protein